MRKSMKKLGRRKAKAWNRPKTKDLKQIANKATRKFLKKATGELCDE